MRPDLLSFFWLTVGDNYQVFNRILSKCQLRLPRFIYVIIVKGWLQGIACITECAITLLYFKADLLEKFYKSIEPFIAWERAESLPKSCVLFYWTSIIFDHASRIIYYLLSENKYVHDDPVVEPGRHVSLLHVTAQLLKSSLDLGIHLISAHVTMQCIGIHTLPV
jgi:hypothetical protein